MPGQISNWASLRLRTKKARLILQSGMYNLLTNISEGTALLLKGLENCNVSLYVRPLRRKAVPSEILVKR